MLLRLHLLNPFKHVQKLPLVVQVAESINNACLYRLYYHFYDRKWMFMKNVASVLVNTYYTILPDNRKATNGMFMYNYKNFIRFSVGMFT